MPFKIVQTIEDSQICLSIVPYSWEEDGLLYWPKKNRLLTYKLQKQENSVPDKLSWEKMTCIKKREVSTFEEGEREISKMEKVSDTEEEVPALKRHHSRLKPALSIDLNYLLPDENMACPQPSTSCHKSQDTTVINCRTSNKNETVENESPYSKTVFMEDQFQLIPQQSPLNELLLHNNNDGPAEDIVSIDNQQEFVVLESTNQQSDQFKKQVINNQEMIIQQQAKMQTSLDILVNILNDHLQIEKKQEQQTVTKNFIISAPIDSEEKLKNLEEHLKNENHMQQVVSEMSYICGRSGKQNGMDVCYKLIDNFLERNFVSSCSWTGNTKVGGGSTSKVAIKYFVHFRKCFLKTVLLADKDFSEQKCDIFLKRILKNSNQRKRSKKIMSASKKRPKNLDYSKKMKFLKENVCDVQLMIHNVQEEDDEAVRVPDEDDRGLLGDEEISD